MAVALQSTNAPEPSKPNILGLIADPIGALASSVIGAYSAKGNQEFQREMSNTAHQREVADLKAAGLNPVLSAMGVQGQHFPRGSIHPGKSASRFWSTVLGLSCR